MGPKNIFLFEGISFSFILETRTSLGLTAVFLKVPQRVFRCTHCGSGGYLQHSWVTSTVFWGYLQRVLEVPAACLESTSNVFRRVSTGCFGGVAAFFRYFSSCFGRFPQCFFGDPAACLASFATCWGSTKFWASPQWDVFDLRGDWDWFSELHSAVLSYFISLEENWVLCESSRVQERVVSAASF